MLKIRVMTNANVTEVISSTSATPQQILNERNVSINGAVVSLNGRPLTYDDYDRTFEQLNCAEGATVLLSVIVKADSAA